MHCWNCMEDHISCRLLGPRMLFLLTQCMLSSACSGESIFSDGEENKEVGKGDSDVSAAVGEQQQGVAGYGWRSEWYTVCRNVTNIWSHCVVFARDYCKIRLFTLRCFDAVGWLDSRNGIRTVKRPIPTIYNIHFWATMPNLENYSWKICPRTHTHTRFLFNSPIF